LAKDALAQARSKTQQLLILNQKLNDLELKLKAKTEADLTMKEVLSRVRSELSSQYTPLLSQCKEELAAKDIYFEREIKKIKAEHDLSLR
jgi:hypothetical protein